MKKSLFLSFLWLTVFATVTAWSQGIAPLVFQGKPLFVIGTFDAPDEEDVQEWLAAGGNTVILRVPYAETPAEQRAGSLKKNAAWAAKHKVAAVYYPVGIAYSKKDGKNTVTRPEEVPVKIKYLKEMLAITADHPQTLGYWTLDEPENFLKPAYNRQKTDKEFIAWIAENWKWSYDTLKAGDPDAYVMPTIAWWSTYKRLAPLYDVNVPNEYPTYTKDHALSGPLYNVLHDARKAADAVRATGRTSFVYLPGAFDIIEKNWDTWRPATRQELRYLSFAPTTQGAMGVIWWRLGRCTTRYRQTVVYPVMRELKQLAPWFLGESCDEKVSSNRDTATAEYLKKFPLVVRTLPGEKAAKKVKVPPVPDCSHILRRRSGGSYLLLAVSNRKEPMEVTFTLDGIPELPDQTLEILDYRRVGIQENRIKDTFEPFAVRAYLIEPKHK